MDKYTNMRVWPVTVRKLKILAAHKGLSMIKLLDALVDAELKRLGIKVKDDKGA